VRSIHKALARAALGATFALFSVPAEAAEPASRAAVKPATEGPLPRQAPTAGALPPALIFDSGEGGELDSAGKARGRALYEQGARAYAEARYLRAAELFLEAHRAFPTPQLLFNVGKAYDRAGSASGALSYFRDYLRRSPDAPDHAEVSSRVSELEATLAERGVQQLTILSEPELATVLLDGSAVGVTPWTGETWPGKHRLSLSLPGRQPSESVIEVLAHRADDFRILLSPLPPPKSPPPAAARPVVERAGGPSVLTWVVLAAGTAALGTALFVEMANHEADGISRTGAFFAGAGLSACAVGGVLLYVDYSPSNPLSSRTSRALGAAYGGRF